ncbi:MAG TPA: hypothetical protein GX731_02990 [Clostridiales bacterium]|nr:hypothetical protein [Clostridiales bacterium]
MAKCKSCKKDILEGSDYCEDCLHKDETKSNESYLDNLLNSVMKPEDSNSTDFVDDQDVKDFDQLDIMEDLEDTEDFNDQVDFSNLDEEISISDEELFGISLGEEEEELEDYVPLTREVDADEPEDEIEDEVDAPNGMEDLEDFLGILGIGDIEEIEESEVSEEDIPPIGLPDDGDFENPNIDNVDDENDESSDNVNPISDIDEDILSLLNQMSSDDPFMAGITDMLEGKSYDDSDSEEDFKPAEIGDLLSEGLAGVAPIDEDDMVAEITNSLNEDDVEKRKLEKQEKLKKLTSETDAMVLPEPAKDKAKNKKPGIFSKIFGGSAGKSSKSEQASDKTDSDKTATEETADKELAKKSSKKAAKNKEASKKAKEASKAQDVKSEDTDENQESDSQSNKKVSKKEARKAKKAEKKKAKAITTVVEEVEEDPSTINPVGTAITLLVFGAIAIVIYFGTNSFAYNRGINYAKDYFAKREYTKAYEEISGMDLKEDDVEVYNKLQTVMIVNKQLNSYYNFYNLGKYPEALDSLLKGLQRYDKYIELATFYGIKSDLDFIRDQIVVELGDSFELTEEDAINLINIGNKTEYSTELYKVAMGSN